MTGDDAARLPVDPDLDPDSEEEFGVQSAHRPSRWPHVATVLALGLGGAIGATARYAVSLAIPTSATGFPWGTFVINISGSAILGFVLIILIERFPRGEFARPVIGTGIIGAYTTFSTYVVAAILLVRAGHAATAAIYVVASALVGLLAIWLGMGGARIVQGLQPFGPDGPARRTRPHSGDAPVVDR